jgi:hypothetical protein
MTIRLRHCSNGFIAMAGQFFGMLMAIAPAGTVASTGATVPTLVLPGAAGTSAWTVLGALRWQTRSDTPKMRNPASSNWIDRTTAPSNTRRVRLYPFIPKSGIWPC